MAKAMDVADMIITEASGINHPVSNLKLQKIMYFLNVIHLLNNHTPLIDDARFEKWDYGPVIHAVYSEYSGYGANDIENPEQHTTLTRDARGQFNVISNKFNPNDLTDDERQFIKEKLRLFINFDPFTLVDESHLEPQWQDRRTTLYDDQKTVNFYSNIENRFWER